MSSPACVALLWFSTVFHSSTAEQLSSPVARINHSANPVTPFLAC